MVYELLLITVNLVSEEKCFKSNISEETYFKSDISEEMYSILSMLDIKTSSIVNIFNNRYS
jgi:hypothetical protein